MTTTKTRKTSRETRKASDAAKAARPAKRKKIVSIEQYEAQAAAEQAAGPAARSTCPAAASESREAIAQTPEASERGPAADVGPRATIARPGGLWAAAKVLEESGAMNCQAIVKAAFERGLWTSGGKTPAATIYAAIIREIASKGPASRFRRGSERGTFELNR